MIKKIPYFPLATSIAFVAKAQRLNFVIQLHETEIEPGKMALQVHERSFNGRILGVDHNFLVEPQAYQCLQEFLDDPVEVAGVCLQFMVRDKSGQWVQALLNNYSTVSKKLHLTSSDFKVSINDLGDEFKEEEEAAVEV